VGHPPRLLVLRALGLGDLLTGVPALRGLRRHYDGHRLLLAAPEPLRPLLSWIGGIDQFVPTPGLAPLNRSLHGADLAVNLHGRGPQSTRLLADLEPARLVAFDRPDRPGQTERWRDDEHEVQRWCRLVGSTGAVADPSDLRLQDPDRPVDGSEVTRRSGAVLHPGAASGSRRWPPERFAAVVRHLVDHGVHVTVSGGPAETELVEQVIALSGGSGAECGPQVGGDLAVLARLVATSRLVVVGDTGVAHLATALGTPSVVLFGPTDPARWGPPPGPHHVLWAGATGDPHSDHPHPGLLAINIEEVIAAADRALC